MRREEIQQVVMPEIEASQCFLFSVVVGGPGSAAEEWANEVGAPVEYCKGNLDALVREIDFVFIKLDDNSPKWYQQLLMKMKYAGKHGKVIK